MRRRGLAIVGLVLVLIGSACSDSPTTSPGTSPGNTSNDLLAQIQERGYLNAGYSIYPPYVFLDAEQAVTGVFPDYTAELAKRMGVTANTIVMTSSAFIPALGSGRVDALPGYSETPERAKVADFSDPVMYIPNCVLVRNDSGIATMGEITGKTLAITRGSYYETIGQAFIDAGVFNPAQQKTYDNYTNPVQDLLLGRVDAYLYDSVSWGYAALAQPTWKQTLNCFPIPADLEGGGAPPVHMIVPKTEENARYLAEINSIIASMVQDGTVAKIFAKYGLTEPYLIDGQL